MRVPWSGLSGLLVLGLAYGVGLDSPTLWGDEADTAVLARNVLSSGLPVAYDDASVLAYDGCREMSSGLLSRKLPWLQYYVGALSITLFGETTRGARLLFALIGLAGFLPLRALLRGRLARPDFVAALVLLSPQVVLFARSARYYPIAMTLFLGLLWLRFGREEPSRSRTAALAALLIALFHTQYLIALACVAAGALHAGVFQRRWLASWLSASAAGIVAWLAWYLAYPPVESLRAPALEMIANEPARGLLFVLLGVLATLRDLDFVQALPLLGWTALLVTLAAAGRGELRRWWASPLVSFLALQLVFAVGAGAAAIGMETARGYGVIRYLPHGVVAALVALALLADRVARGRPWAPALLVVLLGSNAAGLSWWLHPGRPEGPPLSWWPAVYGEILAPPRDDWEPVFAALAEASHEVGGSEPPRLRVEPDFLAPVLVYYVGDRVRVLPRVERDSRCADAIGETLGADFLRESLAPPNWLLSWGDLSRPPRRATVQRFETRRDAPDATRPELMRRRFAGPEADAPPFVLYRREGF